MVYSLLVSTFNLEYGGREFESRSLHLKPETEWGKWSYLVVERVLRLFAIITAGSGNCLALTTRINKTNKI